MARRTLRLCRDQRGFTLVEQLVVCAGLFLIVAAIAGMVEVAGRIAPQANERGHALREAQVGLDRMTRELRHAYSTSVTSWTLTASVLIHGRAYTVKYDCSGTTPGSTTAKRCVRTESGAGAAGGSQTVIDNVLNPSSRPVFSDVKRNSTTVYVRAAVEVDPKGKRSIGDAKRVVLEDGFYVRNSGVPPT